MVQKIVCTPGAQNVNGRSQNDTDGFRALVSHALRTGRRWISGLHCDWRWNMGLSPHSWIWQSRFALRNLMTERASHLAGRGTLLPFQTRLTQTKPLLPLSNEHGSQVKDQGRRQCCHNKHKKFPYRPTRYVSLLSGLASYYKVNFRFRQNPLRRTAALIGAKVRRFGNRVEVHHQGRRYWSFMYM